MPEEKTEASLPETEPVRRRWFRILAWPIVALICLEILYLIVGNFFLRSEWGQTVANRREEKFSARWDSGWTWFPGVVWVENLEIGGHARRAEWSASFDEANLTVWWPSLFRRHLRLLRGQAEGGKIDVQTRPRPEGPRPPKKPRRGWRFTLAGLDLETVEEVRINEFALQGQGEVRGVARFQVRGPMDFDLSRFRFTSARLLSGEETSAEPLTVDAAVDIDPVTIGDTSVEEIVSGMTGRVLVESESAGIGFLERYFSNHSWVKLGGRGRLKIDLEMTDGWLAPGSELLLEGPVVEAEFVGLVARGEGSVRGGVEEGASHAEVAVDLTSFSVSRIGEESLMAAGQGLQMRLRNDSTAIDRPAEGVAIEVVLPKTEVPELAAFSPFLPPSTGLAFTGGEAEVAAEIEFDSVGNRGSGWLKLSGERIEASFRDLALHAEIDLDAKFAEVQLATGTADLSGSRLEIDGVRVLEGERVLDEGWWGRFSLPTGTVIKPRQDPSPPRIDGQLNAELRDTGPLVALLEERMPKLHWIDGLLTVENVDAETGIRLQGPSLSLEDLQMTGGAKGRLEVLGEIDLEKRTPEGIVFMRWAKLSAALALEEGDRDWKLTGSRRWYEERAALYRGRDLGDPPVAPTEPASVIAEPEPVDETSRE